MAPLRDFVSEQIQALAKLSMPGQYFLLLMRGDDYTMQKPVGFDLGFPACIIYELLASGRVILESPKSPKLKLAPNVDSCPLFSDDLLNKAVQGFKKSKQTHEISTWIQRLGVWNPRNSYKLCNKWCRTYGQMLKMLGVLRETEFGTMTANKYFLADDGIKFMQFHLIKQLLLHPDDMQDVPNTLKDRLVLLSIVGDFFLLIQKRFTREELKTAKTRIKTFMDESNQVIGRALIKSWQEIHKSVAQ